MPTPSRPINGLSRSGLPLDLGMMLGDGPPQSYLHEKISILDTLTDQQAVRHNPYGVMTCEKGGVRQSERGTAAVSNTPRLGGYECDSYVSFHCC